MKFITATISAATISTVAGHCDWDFTREFAKTAGYIDSTLKDGIRTIKPYESNSFQGYFKLKKGVSASDATCDFSTVDLTSDSDSMSIAWYSSDRANGHWGDFLTILPHKSSDQVQYITQYGSPTFPSHSDWNQSPVSFGNDDEFHNFTARSHGDTIEWSQTTKDNLLCAGLDPGRNGFLGGAGRTDLGTGYTVNECKRKCNTFDGTWDCGSVGCTSAPAMGAKCEVVAFWGYNGQCYGYPQYTGHCAPNRSWKTYSAQSDNDILLYKSEVYPSDNNKHLIISVNIKAGGHIQINEKKEKTVLTPEQKIAKLEAQNAKLEARVKSLAAGNKSLTAGKAECEADFIGYRKGVSSAIAKVRAQFVKHN